MSSNRLAIGQSLQAFLAGVQNPNTSAALFQVCKLGSVFDPTAYTSFMEIVYLRGESGPVGSGGNMVGWRIEETLAWQLTGGWDYEQDSTAAMDNMLTAMDILVPTLHQHYQLPLSTNPSIAVSSMFSFLVQPHDRMRIARFPNGRVYALWDCYVVTKQQYGVDIVSP